MFAELSVPVHQVALETAKELGATPGAVAEAVNIAIIGVAMGHLGESDQEQHIHALLEQLAGEIHQLFEREGDFMVGEIITRRTL